MAYQQSRHIAIDLEGLFSTGATARVWGSYTLGSLERATLRRMQNPVRGLLHGSAAVASVAGLVVLLDRSDEPHLLPSAVYGLALTIMYTTSALYHSVPWGAGSKQWLQRLDHASIYALVAATFTLMADGVSQGRWVTIGVGSVWCLLILGVGRELVSGRKRWVLLTVQVVAVGFALPALWLTLEGMDGPTMILTLAGGAWYLIGVLLFVNGVPRLQPRVFSHHEFFHVMVIVASGLHFLAVWRVVSA